MILLRSDLDAEKRDVELAKFEAYLKKEGAVQIDALVRSNSQALAYPIKGYFSFQFEPLFNSHSSYLIYIKAFDISCFLTLGSLSIFPLILKL